MNQRTMKFANDGRIIDAFDTYLQVLAKLRLITDECNTKSWTIAWERYVKSRGYKEGIE